MFKFKKEKETYYLTINDRQAEVTRKRIKSIRLKVNTASKKIRVSCPYGVSEKTLIDFVESKEKWIEKHLSKKVTAKKPVTPKKFEGGESIPFKGAEFDLEIRIGATKTKVEIEENKIILSSKKRLARVKRERAIQEFYRAHLKQEIPNLIEKWEPIMGVSVSEFGVKRMKTRWGTCNIRDKRIWLSLALAEKSPELLEYVVVHEMVHLLERLHNQRFKSFMTQFLPNWKELQKQLNGRID